MKKIFKQYYPALCLFSNRLVKDVSLAEDIVQEVFIRFMEEWQHKNIQQYYRSWLYTAVKNASLNALRERKRVEEDNAVYAYMQMATELGEPNVEHFIIRTETARQLWCEVQRLPSQMQQVIRLHFFENRSIKDIAKTLKLHVSTVKTQKQRGLALLRKYLTFITSLLLFYLFKNIF